MSTAMLDYPIKKFKLYPDISLEAEWKRQAQNLASLLAKELKFATAEKYIASLPKFKPQPKKWQGLFDTPIIVETRVSPKRQAELIGMRYYLEGLSRKKEALPQKPYTIWLDDGRNKLNKMPREILKNLKAGEAAATELEGIALYISNPEVLDHHFLYLPGTIVESDYSAFLDLWYGLPRLDFNLVDTVLPKFGVVVRGRLA